MTTITTRSGKGSPLTWVEVDENFTNLNSAKLEASALVPYETSAHAASTYETSAHAASTYVTNSNPTTTGTLTHSGDIILSGSGKRITGDFSNSILANRVMFQTSIVNGQTSIGVLPNGTSTGVNLNLFGGSDPANASIGQIANAGTDVRFSATLTGTGTYIPMTFHTGGSESFRCAIDGTLTVSKAAGLGYGTGAGGTVTQSTSKSTAVTLNKPTGQITMSNAALAAGASVYFTLNNSLIANTDTVILSGVWGFSPNYRIECLGIGPGACGIRVTNISAGSLSEALVINFAIIKGATA